MKRINVYLSVSILLNVIVITFGARLVNGMGGMQYFKLGADKKYHKSAQNVFSYKQKNSIFQSLPQRSNEIIFIGDSNIQYGEWNDMLDNNHIRNRGISGDDIAGVTARINDIIACKPRKIFLMVGINNLLNNHDDEKKVITGYQYLLKLIRTKSPNTRLYVHSLLPTYNQNTRMNKDIKSINNKLIKISAGNNATFVNIYEDLKDMNGNLAKKYSFDGIHLNGDGYDVWKTKIQNYISE
jgi:lysophospholipase L1-like esterase